MSNASKNSSEKNFQEKFVKRLTNYKWQAPDELNGNLHKVTTQTLIDNWRAKLNKLNADVLEGVELTDDEFRQVMAKVKNLSNSYEAAKMLSVEGAEGKIDGIKRDRNENITRESITLKILKKAEVGGGDSTYEIAREVTTELGNRFDIVLLINGLPLINIEQKRADKNLDEAFFQFKRYYTAGEYSNSFFAFSQMMVITSEVATKYFATPKELNAFNQSFVFHWADVDNKVITNWEDIIDTFLRIPMAHQMVANYVVIDEARERENSKHMLMRPYQVHALQAIEAAAYGENSEREIKGGFVWHTTGSGKTITSFKTARFLYNRGGFDKVVFLVDRKDLDQRTSDNFKAYSVYDSVDVAGAKNTDDLRVKLKNNKHGIIVATIHKLNALVKSFIENEDYALAKKNIVFIIDEAHRSTMSDMMVNITTYFKQNSLFYGFTGTPLFEENKKGGKINRDSEVINTTEKLFGPLLHKYTIDQAIADGNVLGFNVDYINTGEFINYDTLRDELIEKITLEKTDKSDVEIEDEVYSWGDLKVETEARDRNIFKYQDATHIPRVVERILARWDIQSQEKNFNAILTVKNKNRVVAYYKEFKKQLKKNNQNLNIAMTFSNDEENSEKGLVSKKIREEMFEDYAKFTTVKFVAGDKKIGEAAYFADLVERASRGGSKRDSRNIDLIIVAEQLLTGYDSKYLNTLYVDRELHLQSLVQAYSRTNRVYGREKEFGSVINFKYPKITEQAVNKALELYGSGGTSVRVVMPRYKDTVKVVNEKIEELKISLPNPRNWSEIKGNKAKEDDFKEKFEMTTKEINFAQQYYEFSWDDIDISEEEWFAYRGAYINLFPTEPGEVAPEIIEPLPGKMRLVGSQKIDAQYIINLIAKKAPIINGKYHVSKEVLKELHEKIEMLRNSGEISEAALLKEFVDKGLEKVRAEKTTDVDPAYAVWKNNKQHQEIKKFANEWGVPEKILEKEVHKYSFLQDKSNFSTSEIMSAGQYTRAKNSGGLSGFEYKAKLGEAAKKFMIELYNKYGEYILQENLFLQDIAESSLNSESYNTGN